MAEAAEVVARLSYSRVPERLGVAPPAPSAVPSGASATMLNNTDLADCTLVLGADRIPVHWFVLYSQSEHWRAMFRAGLQTTRAMEVVIADVSPPVMREVIKYLYTGEVALDMDNAEEILVASVRYQIASLRQATESWLAKAVSLHNVRRVLALATTHGCAGLRDACLCYMLRNLPELMKCASGTALAEPIAPADASPELPLDAATVDGMLRLVADRLAQPLGSHITATPTSPPPKRMKNDS